MFQMKDRWTVPVTAVADEFIDHYMAGANGEYVKVYLYILRHQGEDITIDSIADALNHTEADVRRALAYWKKAGVLGGEESAVAKEEERVPEQEEESRGREPVSQVQTPKPVYSAEQVNRLAGDEDFSQILYIAQKYMNKVFTPRDCQVFAYLYDGLKFSPELLEYLVEYCAQNGHVSLRYMEKVALNWHSLGIQDPEGAREYTEGFQTQAFSVMKAFGLGDRRPAASELETINRWFRQWGFSQELVLMACDRTICAIHSPSFRYADKILSDWKEAGVKTRRDVEALDAQHQKARAQTQTGATRPKEQPRKRGTNQFHNFEQRDTDYDALVLKQLKERVGQ